jgi:hypothetical protein
VRQKTKIPAKTTAAIMPVGFITASLPAKVTVVF